MAESSDLVKLAVELERSNRQLLRDAARADIQYRKQRIDERNNMAKATRAAQSDLLGAMESLQKARAGDRDSLRDAAAKLRAAAMQQIPDLAELGYSADLKALTDFQGSWAEDAPSAWTAATGTLGEGSIHPPVVYPQALNQMLDATFPGAGYNVTTDRATLEKAFAAKGLSPDQLDKALGLVDQARNVWNSQQAWENTRKVLMSTGDEILGIRGDEDEQLNALVERVNQRLKTANDQFTGFLGATPEEIEARIALEKEQFGDPASLRAQYEQNQRRFDDVMEQLSESGEAITDPAMVRWLEDPFTQEWARTNGGLNLGTVERDPETGKVVAVNLGNDIWRGLRMWNTQKKNDNKWGRMFKPAGGQFTTQIVEMRPTPAEIARGEGGTYARFGNMHYKMNENGTFERIGMDDVPAGLSFKKAGLYTDGKGFEMLKPGDLSDPALTAKIATAADEQEQAQLDAAYDKPVVGVREALHAGRAGKQGKGYTAVITPDGERIVYDAAQVRVLEDTNPKTDKAEIRGARGVLRGKFDFGSRADEPRRDDRAERQYYGSQVYEGDAGDMASDEVKRTRDFIVEKETGVLPIDSVVDDDKTGLVRSIRDSLAGRRKPPKDEVKRRAVEKLDIDLDSLPKTRELLEAEQPTAAAPTKPSAPTQTYTERAKTRLAGTEPDITEGLEASRKAPPSPELPVEKGPSPQEITDASIPEPEQKGELDNEALKAEALRRIREMGQRQREPKKPLPMNYLGEETITGKLE